MMTRILGWMLNPLSLHSFLILRCSDAPSAPDPNPGMLASAQASEKVGMRQADIAEKQLEASTQQNQWLREIMAPVINQQLEAQRSQTAISQDYLNYQRSYYRPIEQSLIMDAIGQGYLSDAEMADLQNSFQTDYESRINRQFALDTASSAASRNAETLRSQIEDTKRQLADAEKGAQAPAPVETPKPYDTIRTADGRLLRVDYDAGNRDPENYRAAGFVFSEAPKDAGARAPQQAINGATAQTENITALRTRLSDLQKQEAGLTSGEPENVTALRRDNALADAGGNQTVQTAIQTAQKRAMAEAQRQASSNVRGAADAQRENMGNYFAGLNIRPDAGRFAEINRQIASQAALGEADQMNAAREQVRAGGRAERADAVSMGAGNPGNQATAQQIANTSGNSATGNATSMNASLNQNNAAALPWFSGATGAYGTAGGIYGSEFNARNSAYNAALAQSGQETAGAFGAIGTAVGMFAL